LFQIDMQLFEEGGFPGHLTELFIDTSSAEKLLAQAWENSSSPLQPPLSEDVMALRNDGTKFPTEFNLIRLGGGQSSILIGMVKDISPRVRATADLQLRQVAIESAVNGIVITDRNGKIEWVNPAFTQITGYSLEDARGSTPRVLRSGLHPKSFYEDLWRTILSGKPWHGEMNNQRKDGTLYVEEMTITPVIEATGEITHFIAIKNDITKRKSLEKMQEDMVHSLVHDLRNPLSNIMMSLEMVKPEQQTMESILQIARTSAHRMQGMVTSMLDFSSLEAGRLALNLEPISINNLFVEILALQRPTAAERHLNLASEIDPELPPVYADANLIARVLQNLIDNAMKYSPAGSEIRLTARLAVIDGYHLLIGVHDQGEGIPESIREHLFEKFFTVQGAAQRRGTGLGLAFCKLAVEAHGGKIGVTSVQGRGASFYFSLPINESVPVYATKTGSLVNRE
jgi:hypothetical protein